MRSGRPSRTAQYVAVVRAVLTRRGDLDDPHAAGMLTPSMRLVDGALRLPGLSTWTRSPFFAALAARIALFDHAVQSAIADGIDQIVIVGAGYDSRAWRLAEPGVRYFEVDHPATQADKRRRASAGGPTYVPLDLGQQTVGTALAGSGFDADRRVLYVLEGLTMYLTRAGVEDLLRQLATTSAPGSRLAVNFGAPPGTGGRIERPRQRAIRFAGRLGGEPHRSFLRASEVGPFVEATGWHRPQVVTLRQAAQDLLGPTDLRVDGINPEAAAAVAET